MLTMEKRKAVVMEWTRALDVALLLDLQSRGTIPVISKEAIHRAQNGTFRVRAVPLDDEAIRLEVLEVGSDSHPSDRDADNRVGKGT